MSCRKACAGLLVGVFLLFVRSVHGKKKSVGDNAYAKKRDKKQKEKRVSSLKRKQQRMMGFLASFFLQHLFEPTNNRKDVYNACVS